MWRRGCVLENAAPLAKETQLICGGVGEERHVCNETFVHAFVGFFPMWWCGRDLSYLYLRRHSPGAGSAGITNCVDHTSDGGTPGSAVLHQLTRHFHPVLSPSCVAEDSQPGEGFQVGLDRGSPCLQLASSSSAPRARWCGKEKVLDQLTFGTSCGMFKPAEPSLHE